MPQGVSPWALAAVSQASQLVSAGTTYEYAPVDVRTVMLNFGIIFSIEGRSMSEEYFKVIFR